MSKFKKVLRVFPSNLTQLEPLYFVLRYIDMSPNAINELIEEHRENENLQKISPLYSDELYPWTAGKAPWSIERGGTGIIPTEARNNVKITALRARRNGGYVGPHIYSKEKIGQYCTIARPQDLDPDKLEWNINSTRDLKHCYTLIQSLLKIAEPFHLENVVSDEKEDVALVVSEVDASIEILKNTAFKEVIDDNGNDESPSPPPHRIIKRERSYSPDKPMDRNPSLPKESASSTYRSCARSPPNRDSKSSRSRSPNSIGKSSRGHDSHFRRNGTSDSHCRGNRHGQDSRYSNDRYRGRDDYKGRYDSKRAARR